ncbi:MAG: hypothetical protein C0475_05015 [Planctomyces sp.]|nr:hypothetical protein [Planctomyces sp.]
MVRCVAAAALVGCARGTDPGGRAERAAGELRHGQVAVRTADGVRNLIEVAPGLWSGSQPEGEAGYASLAALGVRTVISVDGPAPDAAAAAQHGIRVVHVPVGYDRVEEDEGLRIARAVRDLPGPVYVHCHHGVHRGPAAACVAARRLGAITPERAQRVLRSAGTADTYAGLHESVREATAVGAETLDAVDGSFPEAASVPGFTRLMAELDAVHDRMKVLARAGWRTTADHPDLVPAREARLYLDVWEDLAREPEAVNGPAGLRESLSAAIERARELDRAVRAGGKGGSGGAGGSGEDPGRAWAELAASCRDCHQRYRD